MTRSPEARRLPAPVLALAAAALFGASTPLAAPLLQNSSPVLIVGLLYLASAVGLGIWWLSARPRIGLRDLPKSERTAFIGAILFGELQVDGEPSVRPRYKRATRAGRAEKAQCDLVGPAKLPQRNLRAIADLDK